MFRIECCNGLRKCRVYALAESRRYKSAYLKIARCSKCRRLVAIIEKIDFNNKKTKICRYGVDALLLYNRNLHNIVYEVVQVSKQSPKVAWTYYKTVNSETLVRRYMDESGNAGEKIFSPCKVISA